MDFQPEDVTIRIVDVAKRVRDLYGDQAESLIGRKLRSQELRFEITAHREDRQVLITLSYGELVTAEEAMKMVNDRDWDNEHQ